MAIGRGTGTTPKPEGGWDPRRHARLWFGGEASDRRALVAQGLAELVVLRERERARQGEKRRDRKRTTSRRELGGEGMCGLTVREMDAEIEGFSDELAGATAEEMGLAAWVFAFAIAPWGTGDWEPGRYVLTPEGARKLVWTRLIALRGMLALQAGYGRLELATIDAFWIVTARPWLADYEIGLVIEAADDLGKGPHGRSTQESALDRHWPANKEDAAALARKAVERWRTLREKGWGEISRKGQRHR